MRTTTSETTDIGSTSITDLYLVLGTGPERQLAVRANAKRDGKWIEIDAEKLVRGDMIQLRLGDIITAD